MLLTRKGHVPGVTFHDFITLHDQILENNCNMIPNITFHQFAMDGYFTDYIYLTAKR